MMTTGTDSLVLVTESVLVTDAGELIWPQDQHPPTWTNDLEHSVVVVAVIRHYASSATDIAMLSYGGGIVLLPHDTLAVRDTF